MHPVLRLLQSLLQLLPVDDIGQQPVLPGRAAALYRCAIAGGAVDGLRGALQPGNLIRDCLQRVLLGFVLP